MFFGSAEKQIVSGEWDVREVPKLPRKYDEYICAYEILVVYQTFKFAMQLLIEPEEGGRVVYIYPYTKRREILRKITTDFSDSLFESAKLNLRLPPEALIADCFRMGKVCFSDNMCGADFKHVNDVMKIA